MNSIHYNVGKLTNILDVESGIRYCGSNQAFFVELEKFTNESVGYLKAYTPSVVVYSDEIKNFFLSDISKIREKLIKLGMIGATSSLYDLNRFLNDKNVKGLSDGLLVFYSEMDILSKKISSTSEVNK